MRFEVPNNLALSPGIYAIVNHVNGRRYIGNGKRLRNRYHTHLAVLRGGKHRNLLLQTEYMLH
jgi:excinuclease UvrABC nuclease subunit